MRTLLRVFLGLLLLTAPKVALAADAAVDDGARSDHGCGAHRLHVHVDVALEGGTVCDGQSSRAYIADEATTRL